MNENENREHEELANIDDIEIQPLADEDLEAVAGGRCSNHHCSNVTRVEEALEGASEE